MSAVLGMWLYVCMQADELVEKIAKTLVDNPTVVSTEDEDGIIIEVFTNGKNIAPLIGRNGRTVEALRILAKAVGYNGKHRIHLQIHE